MAKGKAGGDLPSFEEALEELQRVVRELEEGQLGLSESLARYEQGVRHLKYCHQALAAAERKIELLTSIDEAGNAETEAFEDAEPAFEQEDAARNRRRSKRPPSPPHMDESGDVDIQRGLF